MLKQYQEQDIRDKQIVDNKHDNTNSKQTIQQRPSISYYSREKARIDKRDWK